MKFLLVTLSVFFVGCYNQQKAQRSFARAAINFPAIPAEYCKNAFPVKEIIIQGKDSVRYDTLWGEGETVRDTIKTDSIIYIKTFVQLPGKVITKIINRVDTITKENTAALALCEIERRKVVDIATAKTKEADKWKAIAKKRFWIIVGMGTIMLLGLVATIKKKMYAAK